MLGLTVNRHTSYKKLGLWDSLYPFLHLQLRPVSVAFLPLKQQQRKVHGSHGGAHVSRRAPPLPPLPPPRTCVALSSWSFKSASSRSVSRNWAFNFSFSARICSYSWGETLVQSRAKAPAVAAATRFCPPSYSRWCRPCPSGWNISSDFRRSHG